MMLLWALCGWVLASTVIALLPMRFQYVPGVMLLGAAPVLIIWLCSAVSWWLLVPALWAFVSMYTNPLRYFWARARGVPVEVVR